MGLEFASVLNVLYFHPLGSCFSTYMAATTCCDDISSYAIPHVVLPTVIKCFIMSWAERKVKERNVAWRVRSNREEHGQHSQRCCRVGSDWFKCLIILYTADILSLRAFKHLLVARKIEWAGAGLTVRRWPMGGVAIITRKAGITVWACGVVRALLEETGKFSWNKLNHVLHRPTVLL